MVKTHTFEIRIVETRQTTTEPYDRHRTKRDLGSFAISVQTDDVDAPPSRHAIEHAFRSLATEVAGKVGAA